MGRLDFNLGSKNKMFWNFRHNDRIEDRNNLFKNEATGRDLLRINWGSTLDDVHTFNGATVGNFRLNFSRFREATVSYGYGINGASLGFPASIAAASPKLVLPLIRFNATTAGQDYNQITSDTDSNRPFNIFQVPFAGLIPTSATLNGSTISRQSLLVPYPQFTGITLQSPNAASSYFHSLDVRVEKRYSHGLSMLANFTYSKLIAEDTYKNAPTWRPRSASPPAIAPCAS